jgi:predicted ferric reductase
MNETVKRFLGTFIILLPVFVVVAIWFTMAPISTRFIDTQTTLLSIGRLSGIIGLVLFSLSLILNVRIKPLNKLFLDNPYIVSLHHDLGSWSLILLLIHPLALAARYATSDLYYAAKFLVPKDNLINLAGLVALIIMILAMLVTYYYKANHTLWLWIHRAMLIAYLGAFLHLLFVTSDTSSNAVLKYSLISIMALGILAFTYQRISRRFV